MSSETPAGITLIRDFVNTTDMETNTDDLSTRSELTHFLVCAGLLSRRTPSTAAELALARSLRAAIRRALELNHDGSSDTIPALQPLLSQLPLRLRWEGDGTTLVPVETGVMGGLAGLAIAVNDSVAGKTWRRLKICFADDCAWAYYDASKNQSRNWCEYGCGNKFKTRAYRARRKAAATT